MKQVQKIWEEPMLLTPSVISCCDPCNLERSVRMLEAEGIPALHVDILDGHFSPSMPLGLDAVAQLKTKTALPFDVHLMATEHDFFVTELIGMGVEQIVFHVETERHLDYRAQSNPRGRNSRRCGAQTGNAAQHPGLCAREMRCGAVNADQSRLCAVPRGGAGSLRRAENPGAARDDLVARLADKDYFGRADLERKFAAVRCRWNGRQFCRGQHLHPKGTIGREHTAIAAIPQGTAGGTDMKQEEYEKTAELVLGELDEALHLGSRRTVWSGSWKPWTRQIRCFLSAWAA